MGDNISTVVFTVGPNKENVVGLEYVDRYRELTWLKSMSQPVQVTGAIALLLESNIRNTRVIFLTQELSPSETHRSIAEGQSQWY